MNVHTGSYRPLFIKALNLLLQSDVTDQERFEIQHYLALLNDKSYVFGKPEVISIVKRRDKDH